MFVAVLSEVMKHLFDRVANLAVFLISSPTRLRFQIVQFGLQLRQFVFLVANFLNELDAFVIEKWREKVSSDDGFEVL